jgi:hypothetical protein
MNLWVIVELKESVVYIRGCVSVHGISPFRTIDGDYKHRSIGLESSYVFRKAATLSNRTWSAMV